MIAVDWGSVEETFVVWRIEGSYTLREFQIAYTMTNKMVNSKNHPVDAIVDLRMATIQTNMLSQVLAYHSRHLNKNVYRTIILYHNDFWKRSLPLLENFYPALFHNFIFTASVDEAYLLVLPAA